MKTRMSINTLFALLLMLPLLALTSCSKEDAPELQHTLNDLSGTWTWETTDGDFPDAFEVTITAESDTKFVVNNFLNVSDPITVTVSGTSLTFSGELSDGSTIKSGTGTITNGWETMNISFIYNDGESDQTGGARLDKGRMISKKKTIVPAK